MGAEAFETVMTAHHGEIRRYVARMTGRVSDADDLSQETFVRAYRAWRSLPPDANVRAWLFAIATNLCRNHFRAEKRRSKAHTGVRDLRPTADNADPEDQARFNQARTVIDGVVARLPRKQRTAFILRKIHDLDYDAIGRSLDCSAESARAHVFQALRKIRVGLNGYQLPTEAAR